HKSEYRGCNIRIPKSHQLSLHTLRPLVSMATLKNKRLRNWKKSASRKMTSTPEGCALPPQSIPPCKMPALMRSMPTWHHCKKMLGLGGDHRSIDRRRAWVLWRQRSLGLGLRQWCHRDRVDV